MFTGVHFAARTTRRGILLSLGRRVASPAYESEGISACFAETSRAPSRIRRLSPSLFRTRRTENELAGVSLFPTLPPPPGPFPFSFSLSFPPGTNVTYNTVIPAAEQRFTAGRTADASDAQGHSPSGSDAHAISCVSFARRVGATRKRRGSERGRGREAGTGRKRKRKALQRDRHERRIDGSCAVPSCRLEKSHVLKLRKARFSPLRDKRMKNAIDPSPREATRATLRKIRVGSCVADRAGEGE